MKKPKGLKKARISFADHPVPDGEDSVDYYLKLGQEPSTPEKLKKKIEKVFSGNWGQNNYKKKTAEESKQDALTFQKALEGLSPDQISIEVGVPIERVRKLLSSAQYYKVMTEQRKELTDFLLKEKVPMLKNIVTLSLASVQDYLMGLQDPVKKQALTTKDIKDISGIAKDINELLRLELGQATQNVQVVQYTYEQTRIVLEDLRKDPVFGELYALPEKTEVIDVVSEP